MSAIKLVVADVDGTLITSGKVLTEEAIQAVHKLREAKIAFAVTSGRPPRAMGMLVEPLALSTPIAAFNGGILVRPDLTTLQEQTLPVPMVAKVLALLEQRGLDAWIYRGCDWFVRDPQAPHVAHEQWSVAFAPRVVSDFRGLHDQVVKVVGVSDDLKLVAETEAVVRDQCGDELSAARSQPYYIDVTHPNANKGAVVRRLSAMLEVPMEAIATIGDMPNDVLMFALSGLSIAMGNASGEVQRAARRVTTSNEENGFARAMERYVL